MKLCTFCGSENRTVRWVHWSMCCVECGTCGAQGPLADTEKEAIEKWNDRVDE